MPQYLVIPESCVQEWRSPQELCWRTRAMVERLDEETKSKILQPLHQMGSGFRGPSSAFGVHGVSGKAADMHEFTEELHPLCSGPHLLALLGQGGA